MSIRTSLRLAGAAAVIAASVAAAAADLRTPTAGRLALVLSGKPVGFVLAAEGGEIRGTVTQAVASGSLPRKKSLSSVEYTPLVVRMGVPLDPSLLAWIDGSLKGNAMTQTLQLVGYDAANLPVGTRELQDALITGLTFPPLDASSRQAASIEIQVTPEMITHKKGGIAATAIPVAKSKGAAANAFRLQIGSLPAQRVAKVGALSWRREVQRQELGADRFSTGSGSTPTVGDLELHVALADAQAWEKWFDDFVIRGNSGDDQEVEGAITLMSPDLATPLLTAKLSHVGPFALQTGSATGILVRLYVEAIGLEGTTAR